MSLVKLKVQTFNYLYQLKDQIFGSTLVTVFPAVDAAASLRAASAGAAWCRAGGHYQRGPGGRYRGGLLLMIVLSLALRPFCESYGDDHSV